MRTGRGNHDDPGLVFRFNLLDQFGQFCPETGDHAVSFFRSIHADVSDLIFDFQVKTLVGHSVLSCVGSIVPAVEMNGFCAARQVIGVHIPAWDASVGHSAATIIHIVSKTRFLCCA